MRATPTREPAPTAKREPSAPSLISPDLFIEGNLKSSSDIKIEGKVNGDIRARLLTIGENAVIRGQMMAEEVIVNGRVMGKIRGLRVRLNVGARVEGDILHETIAIEAGAHFEGSVARQENPLADDSPSNSGGVPASSSDQKNVAPRKVEKAG